MKSVFPEIRFFVEINKFLNENQILKKIFEKGELSYQDRIQIKEEVEKIQSRCEHKKHLRVIKIDAYFLNLKKALQCKDCGKITETK